MTTLADFLRAETDKEQATSGRIAIDHAMAHCKNCRSSLIRFVKDYPDAPWLYACGCEKHALYLRCAYEPDHLAWLRNRLDELNGIVPSITGAIEVLSKIDIGIHLLSKPDVTPENVAAYTRRIDDLGKQIPAWLSDFDKESLQNWLDKINADIVYYTEQIQTATTFEAVNG